MNNFIIAGASVTLSEWENAVRLVFASTASQGTTRASGMDLALAYPAAGRIGILGTGARAHNGAHTAGPAVINPSTLLGSTTPVLALRALSYF